MLKNKNLIRVFINFICKPFTLVLKLKVVIENLLVKMLNYKFLGGIPMLKSIKVNLEAIEAMLYFWQAASEKENVAESFFYDVASMRGMKLAYNTDFNAESVRKVLSAIKNRELLSDATKAEKRFWNNNMWMMEDLEYTSSMAAPIKVLNLDPMIQLINERIPDIKNEELEVIFAPLHLEEYYVKDNTLIINFFRVKPSDFDDNTFIGEVKLEDYIMEKLMSMCK